MRESKANFTMFFERPRGKPFWRSEKIKKVLLDDVLTDGLRMNCIYDPRKFNPDQSTPMQNAALDQLLPAKLTFPAHIKGAQ